MMHPERALLAVGLTLVMALPAYGASSGVTVWVDANTGQVRQASQNVSAPAVVAANSAYLLDDTTYAALQATVTAVPANAPIFLGTPVANGDGTYASSSISVGATPTPTPSSSVVAVGANAGSGATVVVVAGSQSDRLSGALQVTAGTLPSPGAIVVVTYPQAFSRPARVFLMPMSAASAGLALYISGQSTTGVTIGAGNVPLAGTVYRFEYVVVP